jgi:hypothetical protein
MSLSYRLEFSILIVDINLSELCTDARCYVPLYAHSLSHCWLGLFPLLSVLYKRSLSNTSSLSLIEIHFFDTHRCFT